MTDATDPIGSTDAFQGELQELLVRADAGEIDVLGGWQCRNGQDHPDWDVVITELAKPDATE